MSERLSRQMDELLDRYDAARRAAESRIEQTRTDEALFLQRFSELRRDVVRPVFEAAGAVLRRRGHEFQIVEEEFRPQSGGKGAEAAIELRVVPEGLEKPPPAHDHLRALSFATWHYNKTISIRNGAAPHERALSGASGAVSLAAINAERVEDEVLKLMASIVSR